MCVCMYAHIFMYVCRCVCMYAHIFMYVCMHMCVRMFAYVCMYVFTTYISTQHTFSGFKLCLTLATWSTLLLLLLPALPSCRSQAVPSTSDLTVQPPATSPTPPPTSLVDGRQSGEGFFMNGSSYAVIAETLRMERGSHIGFSFRTCTTGRISQLCNLASLNLPITLSFPLSVSI